MRDSTKNRRAAIEGPWPCGGNGGLRVQQLTKCDSYLQWMWIASCARENVCKMMISTATDHFSRSLGASLKHCLPRGRMGTHRANRMSIIFSPSLGGIQRCSGHCSRGESQKRKVAYEAFGRGPSVGKAPVFSHAIAANQRRFEATSITQHVRKRTTDLETLVLHIGGYLQAVPVRCSAHNFNFSWKKLGPGPSYESPPPLVEKS